MQALLLAFLSGAPALAYQVVWTREVALLAGIQLDAIATVVAAFFGGLALGSRMLGSRVDRSPRPLRFYALLELGAAALAILSTLALRALDSQGPASSAAMLAASAMLILPVTFLLGGTQPALLRSTGALAARAAAPAGAIQGINTLGAVVGVVLAAICIPWLGLWATLLLAAGVASAVGAAALALDAAGARAPVVSHSRTPPGPLPIAVLALAAAAGVATLGFEVLSARMAAIRLGSSLYAWALVLALFLAGLSAGNVFFARIASRTARPIHWLGFIEVGAAVALAIGLVALHPPLARPAVGLDSRELARVAFGILPGAFAMGGAFPLFARLVLDANPGRSFGALAAWNTAGGIAGSLLAPLVLLPVLGMAGGTLACALLNGLVGACVLALEPAHRNRIGVRPALAVGLSAVAVGLGWLGVQRAQPVGAIHIEHGRHASVAVISKRGDRELLVDGDSEASTQGSAIRTEVLLAAIPLAVHPQPTGFLEIGFGAGITLGTASRFPVEQLGCVEISGAVLRSAPWLEPANRGVLRDPRLALHERDARVFLRTVEPVHDVVVANTLHPWSLGATGLYSVEYFARLRGALAPGGIAAQWIPATGIAPASFFSILRTFFAAFENGSVFWIENNVILLGAAESIELPERSRFLERLRSTGLDPEALLLAGDSGDDLAERWIGDARAVRDVLGSSQVLHDDRPRLESDATRAANPAEPGIHQRLAEIAQAAGASGGLVLWLQARAAATAGDPERAEARVTLAADAGLALARRTRAQRMLEEAQKLRDAGDTAGAVQRITRAARLDPLLRDAALALSALAVEAGEVERAAGHLERWLERAPADAEAWNELAGIRGQQGRLDSARRAVTRALESNPFFPEALANGGLLAASAGDFVSARALRARLAALEHGRRRPELAALDAVLDRAAD